jgi:hypothetical protein
MSNLVRYDRNLFQYKNSTRFNALMDGIFTAIDNTAQTSLASFYDIHTAVGVWLTNLSGIFNVKRIYLNLGNPMIWGTSLWGSTLWGGQPEAILDDLLRSLLIARIKRNNSEGITINYIYDCILTSFAPTYLKVTDGDKTITIDITLPDLNTKNSFAAIVTADPAWFGKPAGVSVTYNYI